LTPPSNRATMPRDNRRPTQRERPTEHFAEEGGAPCG
jgi:hypothetical protein